MISVLLVDDQTLIRQGIKSLLDLTADIRVVAEARDGEEALALIPATSAQVTLLDVRMPRRTGLEVLEALGQRGPVPPVILLTTWDDDAVAVQGIRLGARGFLLKDVTLEQLTESIRTVAAGGTLLQPAITQRILEDKERLATAFPSTSGPEALSPRELEVLRLMAGGMSNKEIARALGTAEGTVKNQVSSILLKLGVRDRTRAVLRALELGYL
ncbi:response regulator [Hyalangium versicolor]|uniref:response regulator n=1 Tax=Hyalangium versicolor TaxID=2861190 RepID=UPI001CC96E03|nr:response regulator transcription factor [Hyalangium versicolor]